MTVITLIHPVSLSAVLHLNLFIIRKNIPGTSKTIKLIAPILDPIQFKGYCIAHIDSWGEDKRKMRNPIKLNFDIKVKDNNNKCSTIDQDPFHECKPVDCDLRYNGYKPIFDSKIKRCVRAVNCLNNKILNPNINKCIESTINARDIEYIKSLDKNERKTKDVLIIENTKKVVESVNATQLHNTKSDAKFKEEMERKDFTFLDKFKNYFNSNKYTFSLLGVVIFIQCILICCMLYFITRSCGCHKKIVVERKYFNYKQDASITTPLIDTSNINTETTDYQYLSESSDIDKKVKCYKACQKEHQNNLKFSLSDDILSRCVNRRDWIKTRSETIPELLKEEIIRTKDFKPVSPEKSDDVEVKIETVDKTSRNNEGNEIETVKNIVKIIEDKNVNRNLQCVSTEKEIKCYSYHKDSKPSVHRKNMGLSKTSKGKMGILSLSTDKSAQASFSKDSIDDFLSERGVVDLAGENMSKYSFSSSSNAVKSSTSISSRTSKNNLIKNVLSLLRRKSKMTSSDPILKKSQQNIDLELIHMSRASVFSSSNDSACKRFQRLKDSRTSL